MLVGCLQAMMHTPLNSAWADGASVLSGWGGLPACMPGLDT